MLYRNLLQRSDIVKSSTTVDHIHKAYYIGLVRGLLNGNEVSLTVVKKSLANNLQIDKKELNYVIDKFLLENHVSRTIPNEQFIRIIKKHCDNNPENTNQRFTDLAFFAILELAVSNMLKDQ